MALASSVFKDHKPDERMREIRAWLKSKGVPDFEPVSLFCDQLSKVRILSFTYNIVSRSSRKLSRNSNN